MFRSVLRLPEFKKIPDESKVEAIKSLLKAYQGEIDQLTRRSKVSESAFLNAYKLLAEAPDPYPLLDAAVVSTVSVPVSFGWAALQTSAAAHPLPQARLIVASASVRLACSFAGSNRQGGRGSGARV